MSTIVYQNLVPCFETQFKETATTIKLKLADSMVDMNTSLEYGNWGLLEKYPKHEGKTSCFYSSSFSRLSAKSLELCTENLGSESGSDVFTDTDRSSIFSSSNLIQDSSSSMVELVVVKPPKQLEAKSSANPSRNTPKRSDDFPPPLSSMCGQTSLQMRRRREGGRLIIDAVEEPFRNSYLQAERSDGRLRLYFSTSSSESAVATTSSGIEEEQQQESTEHECCGEPEEITDETQSEIELGDEEWEGGDMNIEMGLEKFQRLSRCKEGGHGNKGLMCSVWKPAAFCVAT